MAAQQPGQEQLKLLWNPENVKDVAESVGVSNMTEETQKTLTQEAEYRIGQVIIEAMRFMKAAGRTTLTVQDINAAMRVLDIEPLYGYDSTRPLRYGEASFGPGQPIFYVEDEEVDFEKIINAPLPKIPRDCAMTAHWLAVEGVQPSIPQNPIQSDARANELLPKGHGGAGGPPGPNNPAALAAAMAGNENVAHRPAVKHVLSREMSLYFEKIQAAILDDDADEEVARLRHAALASVRDDPGIHQLVPYFVNFISNQVTHHLDDVFVLRQMMELTAALIANRTLYLDTYASPLSAPALTCLLGRRLGPDDSNGNAAADGGSGSGSNSIGPGSSSARNEQYQLREFSASIVGELARRFSSSNSLLRSKLTRTCLKYFLDKDKTPAVWYGAIRGLMAAGGPETVRYIVLDTLKSVDEMILEPLRVSSTGNPNARLEFDMLVGAIVEAITSISPSSSNGTAAAAPSGGGGVNGNSAAAAPTAAERKALEEYVGPILSTRVCALGDPSLVRRILERRDA